MTAADLEALAARVEQAAGPDTALELEIARVRVNGKVLPQERYTASVDAALTLVPEGYRLQVSEWDDEKHLRPRGPWQAILSENGSRNQGFDPAFKTRCEHAATPALAITAAALRAHAALNPNSTEGE